jgi:hypothetical protein
MRKSAVAIALVTVLLTGGAMAQSAIPREPSATFTGLRLNLVLGQFFPFGGRNYCWYEGGWHGPGYDWRGYACRRGYGWGGGYGWHGFHEDYEAGLLQ